MLRRASTAAEPPLEIQYSNKRVKRSADIPEDTESAESTIRRKNAVDGPVSVFGGVHPNLNQCSNERRAT